MARSSELYLTTSSEAESGILTVKSWASGGLEVAAAGGETLVKGSNLDTDFFIPIRLALGLNL